MADVSQTATAVHAKSDTVSSLKEAGEPLVPGNWVYKKTSDKKHYKAAGNVGTEEATVVGMCLGYAPADGDYVEVATGGSVDVGATLTVGGGPLLISAATAGNMAPVSDLSTGEYGSILGVQVAADDFKIQIENATVASA